jgi:uncharacterized membrane protein YedE/YeeE
MDQAIETWKVKPITVTTDLGKMFRWLEVWINHLFGFTSELYGKYAVDWVMSVTWWAFIPWIGTAILGMIIGWFLVVLFEKQNRLWVKYSGRLLLVAFIGWMFFSYGTRLAGGCTLNHLLGWVPMMNIHSLVAIVFMSMWGLTGFWLMTKLGLAKYFKHQEDLDYVKAQYKKGTNDWATYDPNYRPWKNPMVWLGLTFLLAFVWFATLGMISNPEFLQHMKGDSIKDFGKSFADKGISYVIITLLAWIIAGFAMAKSGFGTECALISAEASSMIRRDEKKWNKLGLPNVTRTLFKGLLPLQWVAAMWVIVSVFVLITIYFLGMKHWFTDPTKYKFYLTAWVPIGWFFLGFGAVLLIGCEIRSYMRLGMLYLNTLIWFIGFAVWYLPFTLFYSEHKEFLSSSIVPYLKQNEIFTIPELVTSNPTGQVVVATLWTLMLIGLLTWTIRAGKRYMGVKKGSEFLTKNTEEIHKEYGDELKWTVKYK